jgi:hypothetical protein
MVVQSSTSAWESKLGDAQWGIVAPKQLEILCTLTAGLEEGEEPEMLNATGIPLLSSLVSLPSLEYQFKEKWNEVWNFSGPRTDETTTRLANEKLQRIFDEFAGEDPLQRLLWIRRLGCLHIQLERHNLQNYGKFMQRVVAMYDVLFRGSVQLTEIPDIQEPDSDFDTRPQNENAEKYGKFWTTANRKFEFAQRDTDKEQVQIGELEEILLSAYGSEWLDGIGGRSALNLARNVKTGKRLNFETDQSGR